MGRSGEDRRLAAGARLGPYEIVDLLGAGGMGEVYRARDPRLGRVVAIKVLSSSLLLDGEALRRFELEARAAAATSHANVVAIYDFGRHEDLPFVVSELLEGATLGALLADGPLPSRRALDLARQVAEGLAAAHDKGIVHRDLKPENIFVTRDDRVKILDFGLAKLLEGSARLELDRTAPGRILGTAPYMSPEQVRGEDVDHRSDLFSFGTILYCMVAGRRPFGGSTPADAMSAILRDEPAPAALPAGIARIIARCLAKRPEARYQRARDILVELEGLTLAPTQPHGPVAPAPVVFDTRVAILPFRVEDVDDGYLADGLVDDLIDALSSASRLRVRSRGAVMRYLGVERDPRELGQELGVDVIIEGSLRRTPHGLLLATRASGVADGFQLWSRRFDLVENDLLVTAGQIAHALAKALGVELAARNPPLGGRALDLYLRGRQQYHRLESGPGAYSATVRTFEEALRLEPESPVVFAAWAMAQARVIAHDPEGGGRAAELAAQVRRRAEKELIASPEPFVALASLMVVHCSWLEAAAALRQALDRAPMYLGARALLGRLLSESGPAEAAAAYLEEALALEPEPWLSLELCRLHELTGDRARVDSLFAGLGRDNPVVLNSRLRVARWRGDAAAIASLKGELPQPASPGVIERVLRGEWPGPEDEPALVALDRAPARRRVFFDQLLAELAGETGRLDEGISALARAAERGLVDIVWMERCPLLAPLRGQPRFTALREVVSARAAGVRRVLLVAG